MKTALDLWQRLHAAGVVEGPRPDALDHAQADSQTPWFINLMLGFCGWLAALFMLGFFAAAFSDLSDQPLLCLVMGVLTLALAFVLLNKVRQIFIDNLALALSVAGQCLVAWACVQIAAPQALWPLWGGALSQLLLAVVMPHPVHRVFSAFAASLFVATWMDAAGLGLLYPPTILAVATLLWLNELNLHADVSRITMPAWGVSLAMLLMLFVRRFEHMSYGWFSDSGAFPGLPAWLGEALCAVVMLCVLAVLLRRSGVQLANRAGLMSLLATAFVGIVSVLAYGLSSALTLVMLGFALANRALLGLGVVAGLIFLSSYYYLLSISLLHKALVLLVLGLVMLGLRLLLVRRGAA